MKTLEDQEREARAVAQQTRESIKKLEEQRQSLALEAVSGSKKAAERAAKSGAELQELTRRAELADLAAREAARRQEQERHQEEERARAAAAREYDRCARQRRPLLESIEHKLTELDDALRALLECDSKQQAAATRAALPFSPGDSSPLLAARVSAVLARRVPIPASSHPASALPLGESDRGVLTISEMQEVHATAERRAAEQAERERLAREAVERRERIAYRRAQLLAWRNIGLDSTDAEREHAEKAVDAELRREYPDEYPETEAR